MAGMYGDPNYFANMQNMQRNPGWPSTTQWAPPQLKTNRILVTSLEEAIAKSTDSYSEMYYFDQNKPVFYIVRTDINMVKSWTVVPYTLPNQENSTPATKADLASLEARLEAKIASFEPKVTQKKKKSEIEQEVTENGESLG